jgi:carbon-monoxide dehydrogenase medium subunit
VVKHRQIAQPLQARGAAMLVKLCTTEPGMSLDAHPSLPEFEYVRPQSLMEASQFLAEHQGAARPLLGGTDVLVRMRDGDWTLKYLVDIKRMDGMNQISFEPREGLVIGAAVSMNRVIAFEPVREHYAVLAEAAESCASYQLRTRATIVGNICNASPAGDSLGACLLLDGVLDVHGIDGIRTEPLGTFFRGPGSTTLRPGDIVTALRLPPPRSGLVGGYIKLGRNKLSDLAIVGVTAVGYPRESLASGFRIRLALASVAPTPLVLDEVETILSSRRIDAGLIAEAAQAAMTASSPIDDVRGSARYRRLMVRNLAARALSEVWQQLSA